MESNSFSNRTRTLISQVIRLMNINNLKKFLNLNDDFSVKECTQDDIDRLTTRKTRFQLIILSLVVCGIEFCYAAETGKRV